ncbi:MAG TPA: gamma-glutamyltransferase [Dongiaceae bacterium]|jgi:gamma-glutamyltranspeptidase/glutathione hydrolase|nr:gamma-glutamyltransferase [Dongiaceae bacterium]
MPSAYHTFTSRSSAPGAAQNRHFSALFPAFGAARLAAGALAVLAVLSGCGSNEKPGPVGLLFAPDFRGGLVTDEPRASLVGRDIIAAGGNAIDAAVAAYFTLSVTMPSAAGLGGGGVCLVHDADKNETVAFDFLPRPAKGGLVAIPGNVRGMAAINARYGALPWAQLVAPAGKLASGGTAVSRALASEIADAGTRLDEDPQMKAIFAKDDGSPLGESDHLLQVDLGATLERVRVGGVNEFYSGLLAQKLSDAAQSIGAPLTIEDLRTTKTVAYKPLALPVGDQTLYAPAPPASGGVTALQLVQALMSGADHDAGAFAKAVNGLVADRDGWMKPGGDASQAPAALIDSGHVQSALGAKTPAAAHALDENPSATGLVAIDNEGRGVACEFTMNAPFGSGRIAPGTGIILAPAPNAQGAGFSALGPLMLANDYTGRLYFAAAASGGVPGDIAKARLFDAVRNQEQPLDQAMQAGRLFADGAGTVYLEDAASGGKSAIAGAGMTVEATASLGRVNAAYCPRSTPSSPDTCQLRNDYRGNGLVTTVNQQ